MIAADHHDRKPAAQLRQGGGDVEATAGNHPTVGEPEVEEIAVEEEAVAQVRHRLQKCQERLLDPGRRHAEMGIRHDDQRMAQHGAKDEPLGPPGQPRPVCDCGATPSVTNPERPA